MKKTDFIKQAYDKLLEDRFADIIANTLKGVEAVLIVFEELGMLPPNDGKKRYIKKSSVPCVINARNCHQWGEEDE